MPYTYVGDVVELARQSDYLMVACKGGPETRHLVSRAVIDALGPKGTLINVARGTVVDEEALIDALANKRLGWAALDVFENSPNFDQRLLDFPNVILQPHHGTAAIETRLEMGQLMIDNLAAGLEKRPLKTPVTLNRTPASGCEERPEAHDRSPANRRRSSQPPLPAAERSSCAGAGGHFARRAAAGIPGAARPVRMRQIDPALSDRRFHPDRDRHGSRSTKSR